MRHCVCCARVSIVAAFFIPLIIIAAIPRWFRCVCMSISLEASRAEHARRSSASRFRARNAADRRECASYSRMQGRYESSIPPDRIVTHGIDRSDERDEWKGDSISDHNGQSETKCRIIRSSSSSSQTLRIRGSAKHYLGDLLTCRS